MDTRNWLPGKKVLISPRWISGVSWADAEVHADLGNIEIIKASAWDPGPLIVRECATSVAGAKTVLKEPQWAAGRETSAGKSE